MVTDKTGSRIPVADLRAALEGQIRRLADELAPDRVRVEGYRRWSLNPTRPDGAANSFVIDIGGDRLGRWYEFAGAFGGDVIDLISYCRFAHGEGDYQSSDNRGRAIGWAKAWLGWDDRDPQILARSKAEAEKARRAKPDAAHVSRGERDRRAKRAKKRWLSMPELEGSIGATYLERARGIPLAALAGWPRAIRFAPELADKETGEILPGLLSAMSLYGKDIRAVHMTFLDPSGAGKADVARPRKMFGDVKGAAIRLAKGRHDCSPEEAARREIEGETLAIAEGIEDGLSWALMEPADRVWAAGALGFIGQVVVPPSVAVVKILAQNDPDGSPAAAAFERQAETLTRRYTDKTVIVERPRDGIKDWNDLWRAAA